MDVILEISCHNGAKNGSRVSSGIQIDIQYIAFSQYFRYFGLAVVGHRRKSLMNTSSLTSDAVETATPRWFLMIAAYCVSYALISKFSHTSNSKINIHCAAFYSSYNLNRRFYKFPYKTLLTYMYAFLFSLFQTFIFYVN